jgi:hypothetical protein
MIPCIIKQTSITLLDHGTPITIERDDPRFDDLYKAIKDQDWELVTSIANKPYKINQVMGGLVRIIDGVVWLGDRQVKGYLADKIDEFMNEGLDISYLINFAQKLYNNPSKSCVDGLLTFLEHGNMPIDPDGDFYAYKAVRKDLADKYTGTISNKIGSVVEVPRNEVDDKPENACSHGLHVGTYSYATGFASGNDIVLIVKVNPEDVVTVPRIETTKLRCCKYIVHSICEGMLPNTAISDHYNTDSDEDDEEYKDQ